MNHWETAIATHNRNKLGKGLEADIYITNPRWAVPGGHLDLLCASPECIYHSIARAGRGPCDDQSRSAAMDLLRWIDDLDVDWLQVENVKEFVNWGPLDKEGNPIKEKAGTLFNVWLKELEKRGYKYEYKILNSADYGAYTSRVRFFLIATKTGKAIKWPEKTYENSWKPAKDIIDWSISGESVFLHKTLVRNSMRRICHGLEKFNGIKLDLDYACECAENRVLPQVRHQPGLESFFTKYNGGAVPRAHSINEPIRTIDTSNRFALLTPYFVENFGTSNSRSIDRPLSTVMTTPKTNLIRPYLLPQNQGFDRMNVRDLDRPMNTITSKGADAVLEPFLTKYYGAGNGAVGTDVPLPTITTKDRFGLNQPKITDCYLDVTYRLMEPHELAAAMGFPADYQFAGTKTAIKKQIGNAVEVNIARELVGTILDQHLGGKDDKEERISVQACA
jgi:DNA (cytosine-5)-methyltransferase 1